MATSLRDLLRTLEQEAPYAAGTPRQIPDSSWSLAELGRALRQLSKDGLDDLPGGDREQAVADLAECCTKIAATVHRTETGRLTDLAGAVADVVSTVRGDTGRDERWAIVLGIASAVRIVSMYAAEGDSRRTADVAWAHLTARALVNSSEEERPRPESGAILDRAVPLPMIPDGYPPARVARESMVVVTDRLRRAAQGETRRPSLLEIFAASRAAESTVNYATAAQAAMTGRAMPNALPAVAVWREVREQLRPFVDSAPLKVPDRDLGVWAQRAHSGLRQEFGPVAGLHVMDVDGLVKVHALRDLQASANEVPAIAYLLTRTVTDLADYGELHSLATRLPFRQNRLREFTANRTIVADREDVAMAVDRLSAARSFAATVAVGLDRATSSTIGREQPGLVAAHETWLTPSRDPHTFRVAPSDLGLAGDEPATVSATIGALNATADLEAEADDGADWYRA